MKLDKTWIVISGIIFVAYNFLIFLIADVEGHGAPFWVSYVMALIMMISVFLMMVRTAAIGNGRKILFLGYSSFVWSGGFLLVQLVITTLFMILDSGLKAALGIEVVVLLAYIVISLTCFKSQEVIQRVQEQHQVSTGTMKMLKTQVGTAVSLCEDAETVKVLEKLQEEILYSDKVSSEETAVIEAQMLTEVELLKSVCQVDAEQTKQLCQTLMKQLRERNVLCQNFKKRY